MNRMRERRGSRTLKQIEEELGRSYLDEPMLSRIETGKLNPVPGDIPAFLAAYGAEEVTELWDASDLDYGVKRPCGGRKPDRNKKTGRIHIRTTQKIAKRFHAIRRRYGYHTGEQCFIAALDALEQEKKRTAPTAGTVETAGVSRSPQSKDSPSIGQGGQNVNGAIAAAKPI